MHKKYFLYLYKHKHLAPRTISKGISETFNNINVNDIYTKFIFYIFFVDICGTIECPQILRKLYKYEKIILCIKNNFFCKSSYFADIKELPIYKIQMEKSKEFTQEELYNIFVFLLNMELTIHNLYLIDKILINKLISNMSNDCKYKILNLKYKISPLLCLLLVNIEDENIIIPKYKSVYDFLNVLHLDFRNALFFLNSKNINYKKLEKRFLYSKFKIINEYHKILINFYPEIIYNCKVNIHRIEYLNNPLNIPLDYKILRGYIFCIPYFLKITNLNLNDPNFDILFRTIYIEKILENGLNKKWCKLLHIIILDNQNILYILLRRRFNVKNIKLLVKFVPSFHLAFDQSLKLFRETENDFYKIILKFLIRKYPLQEYFRKLLPYKGHFSKKYKKYFEGINN